MRTFKYRSPRFRSTAELALHIGEETMEGVCNDLSREGLLATFEKGKQEVGSLGWILLRYSERQFNLGVVVTHREDTQVGLSFLRRTREERAAAEQFSAFLELEKQDSLLQRPS